MNDKPMSKAVELGRGPTRKAFIENLRVIADQMESVNAEIKMPKV